MGMEISAGERQRRYQDLLIGAPADYSSTANSISNTLRVPRRTVSAFRSKGLSRKQTERASSFHRLHFAPICRL
jgi:hypothetical protein